MWKIDYINYLYLLPFRTPPNPVRIRFTSLHSDQKLFETCIRLSVNNVNEYVPYRTMKELLPLHFSHAL